MNDVRLEVNGTLFSGWTSVTVSAGITKLARDFAVAFTRSCRAGGLTIGVKPGDSVRVYIDDDLVVTGYITSLDLSYSASTVTLMLKGFSKTIDLCDCQAPPGSPLAYKNVSIAGIVKRLAGHYGVSTNVQVDASKAIDWDVSPTETIKSTLEKMLKQHTMLLSDNELGELVVLKVGGGGAACDCVKTGENVLTASYSIDTKGVFSDYVVVGQGANSKSERPVTDSQSRGHAGFEKMRKRVNVTSQSGNTSTEELQKRAALLRDYSVGTSETYKCTVQGWRQSDGGLWRANTLVHVIDRYFELDRYFVVSNVVFTLSQNGTVTELELKPLGAFIETSSKEKTASKHYVTKSDTAIAEWTHKE